MVVRTRPGTGTNQEAVRRHNLGTMLRSVHQSGRTSRASLTGAMALNRSTIAGLALELEELGLVRHTDPVVGAGAGRPSSGLEVASGGPFVIAIDVGVDRVVVGRVSLGGHVAARATRRLPVSPDPRDVGDLVRALATEVAPADVGGPLVGLGISVPGVVRSGEGVVQFAPNLGWHEVPFVQVVSDRFATSVPIALGNDADLGARAEHVRGAGRGVDHLVYVSGEVGVGAGVISGGAPLTGVGGFAGEIGHIAYDPGGALCHCGNRGCWETEIGAVAIARAIAAPTESVATLGAVLDGYTDDLEPVRQIARHVGRGLATVVNMLNPQVVVLGGYLSSLHALVGPDIVRALHDTAMKAPGGMVRLSTPRLGHDSVLVGASELAFEALLLDPVAVLARP